MPNTDIWIYLILIICFYFAVLSRHGHAMSFNFTDMLALRVLSTILILT